MTKRNLAVLCAGVLTVGAFISTTVHARPAGTAADGCSVLSDLVVTELTLARWYGVGNYGAQLPPPGELGEVVCYQTARTVTAAFSAAFAEMDIDITWNFWPDYRGDSCLSADLSQCYPDRYPLSGGAPIAPAYVLDSWNSVRRAVSSSMPLGTASDTSRFSASQLGSRLGRDLNREAVFTSPLHKLSAYPGYGPREN